jgi:hypothetical protein
VIAHIRIRDARKVPGTALQSRPIESVERLPHGLFGLGASLLDGVTRYVSSRPQQGFGIASHCL